MPANKQRQTKSQRREAAQRAAEELAKKQAATERRNRLIVVGASLLVLVLVIAAGVTIWRAGQKTLLTDFDGEVPAGSTDTGAFTFGAEGVAGTENSGATEVEIYLDFMCPGCGQLDRAHREDIRTMISNGDATLVVHPLAFLDRLAMGAEYSTRSVNALATVADQSPEHALDFMDALFDNQPAENTEGLSDEQMAELAVGVGVPQEVADSFADQIFREWAGVAADQAQVDGVTGTPVVMIDGERWTGEWATPGTLLEEVTGGGAAD
ncbi:MAG: thioredoxin domain-containing protein [Beutenbergiaceae bacterium]